MNRRAPVTVSIAGEDFRASLLTCGLSWKLSAQIRTVQNAMMKVEKDGEGALSPEEEAAFTPALIAIVSGVLLPNHPQCTEAWVGENVFDKELIAILGEVWKASQPPTKGDTGPGAKSP